VNLRDAVLCLAACGLLAACGTSSATEGKPSEHAGYTASSTGAVAAAHDRLDGAYDFCIQQVTDRLKAPATARFSERDPDHEGQDGSLYLFTGTVDSENGFGALIRSDWSCKIRWANGSYSAEAVTVS
jgi:hypothetical protein